MGWVGLAWLRRCEGLLLLRGKSILTVVGQYSIDAGLGSFGNAQKDDVWGREGMHSVLQVGRYVERMGGSSAVASRGGFYCTDFGVHGSNTVFLPEGT